MRQRTRVECQHPDVEEATCPVRIVRRFEGDARLVIGRATCPDIDDDPTVGRARTRRFRQRARVTRLSGTSMDLDQPRRGVSVQGYDDQRSDGQKRRQSRAVAHKDAVNPRSHGGTGTMMNKRLPDPHLTKIYRLEATLGEPQVLGGISGGHRRIVPLTGGTFSGPELRGELVPGASADWQIILPDGATFGDVRYTLATEHGHLLYVQSRTVRHGSPEVLARLGRGEDVDANEYTFRRQRRSRPQPPNSTG